MVRWKLEIIIGSDGTIYFGSYDHYLYAINGPKTLIAEPPQSQQETFNLLILLKEAVRSSLVDCSLLAKIILRGSDDIAEILMMIEVSKREDVSEEAREAIINSLREELEKFLSRKA